MRITRTQCVEQGRLRLHRRVCTARAKLFWLRKAVGEQKGRSAKTQRFNGLDLESTNNAPGHPASTTALHAATRIQSPARACETAMAVYLGRSAVFMR